MPKKTHEHHNHRHITSSQEGFISNDFKSAMSNKEKLIMGALVGGILILLTLSIIVLFSKKDSASELNFRSDVTGGSGKVVLTPYPTIPPIQNMTVAMNPIVFSPSSFSIPRKGFVDFFNVGDKSIIIEANDPKSSMLNLGEIKSFESKSVQFPSSGVYTFRNKDNPTQVGTITIK